jgi:prepilin-type N-terminal cleavage/methylation domain-containing protein
MKKHGFTLIELLVAISVFGIVASIAIPGFYRWLPNYRLKAAVKDLYSNFQLAKMTAARNNSNCCITFNQPIGGRVYDYVVFADTDNDMVYDAGEEIVTRVLWANYKDVTLDVTQGGGDGLSFTNNDDGLPSIAFRSNGLPRNNLGGFGAGTAFFINTRGITRSVILSSGGNIRIQP